MSLARSDIPAWLRSSAGLGPFASAPALAAAPSNQMFARRARLSAGRPAAWRSPERERLALMPECELS